MGVLFSMYAAYYIIFQSTFSLKLYQILQKELLSSNASFPKTLRLYASGVFMTVATETLRTTGQFILTLS